MIAEGHKRCGLQTVVFFCHQRLGVLRDLVAVDARALKLCVAHAVEDGLHTRNLHLGDATRQQGADFARAVPSAPNTGAVASRREKP